MAPLLQLESELAGLKRLLLSGTPLGAASGSAAAAMLTPASQLWFDADSGA